VAGEFPTGPGWAPSLVRYAAGDRILLHTRLGRRPGPAAPRHDGHGRAGGLRRPRGRRRRRGARRRCPPPSSRAVGGTTHRTCRMPGPAPSTAPRAALGPRSTCWSAGRSTTSRARWPRAARSFPPTRGTSPGSSTWTTASGVRPDASTTRPVGPHPAGGPRSPPAALADLERATEDAHPSFDGTCRAGRGATGLSVMGGGHRRQRTYVRLQRMCVS
jgi:hypothetical protein